MILTLHKLLIVGKVGAALAIIGRGLFWQALSAICRGKFCEHMDLSDLTPAGESRSFHTLPEICNSSICVRTVNLLVLLFPLDSSDCYLYLHLYLRVIGFGIIFVKA